MSILAPGNGRWLLVICLSRVGAFMPYIAFAATLPVLQREWQLTGTAAGSIASAFQIAYALSLMGCSAVADRVGARRVFLVGTVAEEVVATVMAGYDGHRGWINYLAVDPMHRRQDFARLLVTEVEERLRDLGCAKINLQIRRDNLEG